MNESTDILDILREALKEEWPQEYLGIDDIKSAANEIERLRREIEKWAWDRRKHEVRIDRGTAYAPDWNPDG